MLKRLLINIGSGYFLKIVQFACGLITVPILVGDNGLGLAGYGQLAVALSLAALMSMPIDGFRLIASKSIGSEKNLIYQEFAKHFQYFLLLTAPVALLVSLLAGQLFSLLGLTGQPVKIIYIISAFFILEQLIYVTEQYYHSHLKTFIVNTSNSVESVARLLLIIYFFKNGHGTQYDYFAIFTSTYGLKLVLYLILIQTQNADKSIPKADIHGFWLFFREAIPLSFRGASNFLVFRMSVICANKYLSSEAAAVFSIIFVTVRGYLAQLFVNVLRPMVIPVVARIKFANLEKGKLQGYRDLISLYEFFTFSAVCVAACFAPIWLPLWLGNKFVPHQALFSLAVGILAIEVAFSVKSLVLVSQNYGGVMAKYSLVACFVYMALLFNLQHTNMFTLKSMVSIIVLYIFLYNGISVTLIFNKAFGSRVNDAFLVIIAITLSFLNFYLFSSNLDFSCLIPRVLFSAVLVPICFVAASWNPIRFSVHNLKAIKQ